VIFFFRQFLKMTHICGLLLTQGVKNWVRLHFGRFFFTNSSGHPVNKLELACLVTNPESAASDGVVCPEPDEQLESILCISLGQTGQTKQLKVK
jgi:hypothetical protein